MQEHLSVPVLFPLICRLADAYTKQFDLSLQSAVDIDGQVVNFSKYAGKKAVIVVNVASACGYTDANYKGAGGCDVRGTSV